MKTIMILDGQGGGIGRKIAECLVEASLPEVKIIAVGSNAIATMNMMKAGLSAGATGEAACIYNAARADIIIGPMGIIFPHAMYGEISPAMALAVAESNAERVLIPVSNRHLHLVGMADRSITQHLEEMMQTVRSLCQA